MSEIKPNNLVTKIPVQQNINKNNTNKLLKKSSKKRRKQRGRGYEYSIITDPYTNITYNLNSKDGKLLLQKYLMKF